MLVWICSRGLVVLAGVWGCLAWFCNKGLATMELLGTAGSRDCLGRLCGRELAKPVMGSGLSRAFWDRWFKGSKLILS